MSSARTITFFAAAILALEMEMLCYTKWNATLMNSINFINYKDYNSKAPFLKQSVVWFKLKSWVCPGQIRANFSAAHDLDKEVILTQSKTKLKSRVKINIKSLGDRIEPVSLYKTTGNVTKKWVEQINVQLRGDYITVNTAAFCLKTQQGMLHELLLTVVRFHL